MQAHNASKGRLTECLGAVDDVCKIVGHGALAPVIQLQCRARRITHSLGWWYVVIIIRPESINIGCCRFPTKPVNAMQHCTLAAGLVKDVALSCQLERRRHLQPTRCDETLATAQQGPAAARPVAGYAVQVRTMRVPAGVSKGDGHVVRASCLLMSMRQAHALAGSGFGG